MMPAARTGAYGREVKKPLRKKPLQVAGLAASLVAGLLLATTVVGGVRAADTTTTETTTETTTLTETATLTETTVQPTTVLTTETLERTTTRQVILPAATTTSDSGSSGDTEPWVWVLLGILAVALIVLAVLLARRPGSGVPPAERRRRLDGAVASWTAQGWALESQSADSAVLHRPGERMLVSVDPAGQLATRPLAG